MIGGEENKMETEKKTKKRGKPAFVVGSNHSIHEEQSETPTPTTTRVLDVPDVCAEDGSYQLYLGDCLEKMNSIPDDSVDLVLCDLPYGTTKCKWDSIIDMDKLWAHYMRVLKKPHGVVALFGQQPFTSMLVASNYKWHKYNLIWKKNRTTRYLLANYRPMTCTEDVCVFSPGGAAAASRHKGNMTYNPQGLKSVEIKKKNSSSRIGKMLNQPHHLGPNNKLTGDSEYTQKFTNYPNEILEFGIESKTSHETQKPVDLIVHLIKTYSNPGETVLDNTMGSGTTGVGCLNTGRKFIGIELEEKYFQMSVDRIEAVVVGEGSCKENV
jgi:site-specific DNA-methyltransferase (adenine-specific)